MYDLIIKNGTVIDGSGSAPYACDVAISGRKIARIAPGLTGAEKVIDAAGLVVTPGFIDSHSHSDRSFINHPGQIEKVEQGITTSIAGQCGSSAVPRIRKETGECYTMGQFLRDASQVPHGSSAMTFVGHSALRTVAMGHDNRVPTEAELQTMKDLLAEAVDNGALGVSFGLVYSPSNFAETPELIELAKVAHEHGGMVSAHLRNEGDQLIESVTEFIEILRQSGATGVYSHHKAMKQANWGKVNTTLAMVDEAAKEGIRIYSDAYPYSASSTSLSSRFVPKEYHAGGTDCLVKALNDPQIRQTIKEHDIKLFGTDLSWVLVTICGAYPEYEGLTVTEIAERRGQDAYDAVFDIVRDSRGKVSGCFFMMCEEDIKKVLAHPRTMICTDSSVVTDNPIYHPRLRASFPRVLGKYIREEKIVPLEEMIRKMTSLPAEVYGIPNKGLLKEGYDADICIFDPERIVDRADYLNCSLRCDGLNYVLVGGEIAAENATYTGTLSGKIMLRSKTL